VNDEPQLIASEKAPAVPKDAEPAVTRKPKGAGVLKHRKREKRFDRTVGMVASDLQPERSEELAQVSPRDEDKTEEITSFRKARERTAVGKPFSRSKPRIAGGATVMGMAPISPATAKEPRTARRSDPRDQQPPPKQDTRESAAGPRRSDDRRGQFLPEKVEVGESGSTIKVGAAELEQDPKTDEAQRDDGLPEWLQATYDDPHLVAGQEPRPPVSRSSGDEKRYPPEKIVRREETETTRHARMGLRDDQDRALVSALSYGAFLLIGQWLVPDVLEESYTLPTAGLAGLNGLPLAATIAAPAVGALFVALLVSPFSKIPKACCALPLAVAGFVLPLHLGTAALPVPFTMVAAATAIAVASSVVASTLLRSRFLTHLALLIIPSALVATTAAGMATGELPAVQLALLKPALVIYGVTGVASAAIAALIPGSRRDTERAKPSKKKPTR